MKNLINEIEELLEHFKSYDNKVNINPIVTGITDAYTEVHRHYHNLNHLSECLTEFTEVENLFSHYNLMKYVLVYHDIIYVPAAKYNEEMSITKATIDFKKLGYQELFDIGYISNSRGSIDLISLGILATKHNVSIEEVVEKNLIYSTQVDKELILKDLKLVSDIDLSIFGQSKKRIDEYEHEIREEFDFVEDKVYKEARIKILSQFLEKKYIYKSRYFRNKYQKLARENLTYLIDKLNPNFKDASNGTTTSQPG